MLKFCCYSEKLPRICTGFAETNEFVALKSNVVLLEGVKPIKFLILVPEIRGTLESLPGPKNELSEMKIFE